MRSSSSPTTRACNKRGGDPKQEFDEQEWAVRNVHQLRGHKAWVFENGIRVPLLIRRPGVIEPIERKYEDHHLVLRGPRFKYHSLPGGRSCLFDLDADPGETTDVTDGHAAVAAAMSARCRARWDAIISAGRTFAAPRVIPAGRGRTAGRGSARSALPPA